MNFSLPPELLQYIQRLDAFIAAEITPLQNTNDNNRFFDHRREFARTDTTTGLPKPEWTSLLAECVRRADRAGFWRLTLPKEYGGSNPDGQTRGMNLWMAAIRMHLAGRGLGLFNDLQTEHSVVGNFPLIAMVRDWGRPTADSLWAEEGQRDELIRGMLAGDIRVTFGLTEPEHGSDATHMSTSAARAMHGDESGWRISGKKMWQTGMDAASHTFVFARTSGQPGDAAGISCFVVPVTAPGFRVDSFEWTFNMPTDHATVSLRKVFVPDAALLGPEGSGLSVAQAFINENRIRQAASSLGAAQYCIRRSIRHALTRHPFGTPLAANQAIQFPLVRLHTQATALRLLILQTASAMDEMPHARVEDALGDRVSMCNFWANNLVCAAADRAMQVHGGWGYSRHLPFEHIYRHHRRYRITEGSDEVQMRKVGAFMFGFGGKGGGGGAARL